MSMYVYVQMCHGRGRSEFNEFCVDPLRAYVCVLCVYSVRVRVCVHVCMCVCMCMCMCACTYICMHACMCVCMVCMCGTCKRERGCDSACVRTCVDVNACVYAGACASPDNMWLSVYVLRQQQTQHRQQHWQRLEFRSSLQGILAGGALVLFGPSGQCGQEKSSPLRHQEASVCMNVGSRCTNRLIVARNRLSQSFPILTTL